VYFEELVTKAVDTLLALSSILVVNLSDKELAKVIMIYCLVANPMLLGY
jgi:hypothetical protein